MPSTPKPDKSPPDLQKREHERRHIDRTQGRLTCLAFLRTVAEHVRRTWSKTPGKLWKVGGTAEEGARENPAFPPFLHLAAASIRRCCTCVPGVFDQMLGDGLRAVELRHAGPRAGRSPAASGLRPRRCRGRPSS